MLINVTKTAGTTRQKTALHLRITARALDINSDCEKHPIPIVQTTLIGGDQWTGKGQMNEFYRPSLKARKRDRKELTRPADIFI